MQLCGRQQKVWLIASVIAILFFYLLTIYYDIKIEEWTSEHFLFRLKKLESARIFINLTTKRILYWNTMFGDETFYLGSGDVSKNCPGLPINSCFATHDRDSMDINEFDVILFHSNELSLMDLPKERNSSQRYIFVSLESPVSRPINMKFVEDFFNLTMTYRLDSDISWPYYAVRDKNNEIVAPMMNPVWKIPENATGESC